MISYVRLFKLNFGAVAVLAMALSFMAQITPLWLKSGDGLSIEICTAFGIETIIIDENGQKIPAPVQAPKNNCSFCLVSSFSYDLPAQAKNRFTSLQNSKKLRWVNFEIVFVPQFINDKHFIRAPPLTT